MMRLHAVRVAGVRRFADPVAVEGFGAGLNLLSGPNELGKSTLLQALRAAMFETYSGNSQSHRDLASTEGGDPAPLIEVEFEAGGRMWRLRKQFLGAPKATLLDMGSGAVLRNAEAQAQLAALLHGPSDLRPFGLLWVSQAEVLDKKQTIEPEKEFKGLPGFIATAVDAIALDADASAVHEKIKLVLGKLVQDKNRNNPKAGGDWAKARSASEAANAHVEVAQRRLETQAARLAELASKTAARDQLSAPAEVAARGDRARLAGERHARALKAQAARTTSAEKLRTALEAADSAGRDTRRCAPPSMKCRTIRPKTASRLRGAEPCSAPRLPPPRIWRQRASPPRVPPARWSRLKAK